jgi:membrane protein DedA with SNARE-associated domain
MKRSHVSIGVLICCMFIAVIVALFMIEPPARAMEPLLILVGSLAAAFGAVVNYWFGSSSGSARKDELIAAGRGGDVTTTITQTEPPKA